MRYATTRTDGGFELRDDSCAELPTGGMVLTDKEYSTLIDGLTTIEDGRIVPYVPPVPSVAEVTMRAIAAVEDKYKITHRFSREMTSATVLALQTIAAKVNALDAEIAVLISRTPAPIPTLDPPPYGAQVVAAVDAQIVTLRDSAP